MSRHRSLKGASTISAKRNVLKRFERIDIMQNDGRWKQGDKIFNLPKIKPAE